MTADARGTTLHGNFDYLDYCAREIEKIVGSVPGRLFKFHGSAFVLQDMIPRKARTLPQAPSKPKKQIARPDRRKADRALVDKMHRGIASWLYRDQNLPDQSPEQQGHPDEKLPATTDRNPTNAMTHPPDKGGRLEKYDSKKVAQAIKMYLEGGGKRTRRALRKHLSALADADVFGPAPDGGVAHNIITRWLKMFCPDWPYK